ncbi:MAG: hypothetical protein QCI82_00410 [Candidatus Thermoplasmatota archaeon]|nr:hypothetical protein [Candidatus Thermoplasmatota archaeon]
MGCSTSYTIAALLVISCAFLRWDLYFGTMLLHKDLLLSLALLLGSFQLLKYIVPFRSRSIRVLVKAALGISLGSLCVWALTLPVPLYTRFAGLLAIISSIALLGTYRYNYLRKVCSGCIYHGDWDICYGFRTLNSHDRLRNISRRHGIFSLIFDERRKEGLFEKEGLPPREAYSLLEPELEDDPPWLFHNESYRIPWLPRTGLEVSDKKDIPAR